MTVTVSITVNGKAATAEVEPRTLLVQYLRENLGLTGTHVGCDTSQCGACVVHVDGVSVKSCTMLVAQADGAEVTTIEGLAAKSFLHRVQIAVRGEPTRRSSPSTSAQRRVRPELLPCLPATNSRPTASDR